MILVALVGAGLALAADTVFSGGVQIATGAGPDVGAAGLGHEVTVGRTLSERWLIEGQSTSIANRDGGHLTALVGGRRYLSEPWSPRGAISLAAAGGIDILGRDPALSLSGAVDLPHTRRFTTRVSAGWELSLDADGVSHAAARLALALLVPPAREVSAPPKPVVEAPPEPAPRVPLALDAPTEALVWVPHPICEWVPASQAQSLLSSLPEVLPADAQLEVLAEHYLPAHVPAQGEQKVTLIPAPPNGMGALLVLAHPGDQVEVNGQPVPVGDDGVALLNGPEGRVNVVVRAGGQRQQYKAALANGYAVWIRVTAPPPTTVAFSQGSSEISPAAREQIAAMARDAAGWSFVLQGAYSFEGSLNLNNQLARERGQNVGAALLAAGIPAERIAYLEPPSADPTKDPATQRVCNVIAVPPERGP